MYKTHTARVFLVCVILLAGACSDDAAVIEPETNTAAQQPELPVRQWYPTPKHAKPRIAISPAQAPAQMPMTQQPSFNAAPVTQQQWNTPQPYVTPYPYSQRPWGAVPGNTGHKQQDNRQNSYTQGTATDYWGMPVYGGGQYYYPAPGMPGNVW